MFTLRQRQRIVSSDDPVRYGTLMLAFGQVTDSAVPGALAECGVYKGFLSRFIREQMPNRELHLFDTFEGFDNRDLIGAGSDIRFRDTSEVQVLNRIGDTRGVVVHKGYFPETAAALEDERFAFTMIDFDKYEPTFAALNFFYKRTNPGGFIFVHDYSNPESDWACKKALNDFLADKPESAILIPDAWGTALFRKV